MAEITAALVKELRERTGQGMMDCKKALAAAGGDIEKAIDDMRAAGAIKAAKKAGNVAAEGSIGRQAREVPPGLSQASDFFEYMKESFEVLYEDSATGPRMMSIGLHPRMVGRPGRVRAIKRFIEYARQFEGVWFETREEIARAWLERADG